MGIGYHLVGVLAAAFSLSVNGVSLVPRAAAADTGYESYKTDLHTFVHHDVDLARPLDVESYRIFQVVSVHRAEGV